MREIRLKTLSLSNWRAQNRTIGFTDRTVISGRNKSGKSTTKDALMWLLTGYDSEDRFNHRLFDTTVDLTYENSVPASVEGTFDIDGMEYVLKRTARPGWTRKRGNDTYEKKPTDDYSFCIDGVEVSSGDYNRFIETNFCRQDYLKFILNILHYRSLDWKEMRKVLSDVIGEVTVEDYAGDYGEIEALLSKYGSLDIIKDMLRRQRSPIKELVGDKASPGRLQTEIDALASSLPDISDIKEVTGKESRIREEIDGIDRMISGASDSIRPLIEKRNAQLLEISAKKEELERERAKYNAEAYSQDRVLMNEIAEAEREKENRRKRREQTEKNRAFAEGRVADMEQEIARLKEYREELLKKNKEVKSRKFDGEKCSYCGQPLPDDMLETAKATFRETIEKEHSRIVADGKRNNERIKVLEGQLAELRESLKSDTGDGDENPDIADTDALRIRLEEQRRNRTPFDGTSVCRTIQAEIRKMESEVVEVTVSDTSELAAKKAELTAQLMECAEARSRKSEYDRMESEIRKRQDDISANARELARIEGLLSKCEEMEREKAEIIRARVSHLFDICDIRMETMKKDGSTQPACDISVEGIPESVLNTAEIILAGIDLSNAFCKHCDTWMPLIVDNAESVDEERLANKYGRQLIILKRDDCIFSVSNE